MKKEKKISIIIPIYNAQKYLKNCLDSILKQSYKNFELILVNDGSTDNSLEICQKYAQEDKRIKLINQKNSGVSFARNRGFKEASGEYILFVDADDWLELDMLEIMSLEISKKNCEIVKCGYFVEDKEINEEQYLGNYYDKTIQIREDNFLIENIVNYNINPAMWMVLTKKELIKKHKFVENFGYGEDLMYTLDLFLDSKSIVFIKNSLYHYRISDNSASRDTSKYERNINDLKLLHDEIKKILEKYKVNDIKILRNSLKTYYYMVIWFKFLQLSTLLIDEKKFLKDIKKERENKYYCESIKKYGKFNELKLNRKIIMLMFDFKLYNLILFTLKLKHSLKGGQNGKN